MTEAALLLVDAWEPALQTAEAIGYQRGYWAGYDASERDIAEAWHAMYLGLQDVLAEPMHAELQRLRAPDHEPCRFRGCGGRCARCVHAEGWRRRGGQPYTGGPVPWQAVS
ncbi:hypothetical protein [uncultured Jatrophihabitans sp.]|uniref:hypothetical protein n=1 Tax=uncultured Jatrophihabitans sp. TaxID=1610747 RepID=UPI0035CA1FDE